MSEPDQALWLDLIKVEHGNVRAALAWALEAGYGESAADLAGALWRYWDVSGFLSEGRGWLDAALAASPPHSLPRARGLTADGYLALVQGDVSTACDLLEQGLALSRELGDELSIGTALVILGMAARTRGSRGWRRISCRRH